MPALKGVSYTFGRLPLFECGWGIDGEERCGEGAINKML